MPAPKGNKYAKGNKGGRPTRYKKEFAELAYNYCLLGATDAELAQFFDVSEETINNWKKRHEEFFKSLKEGKQDADCLVAKRLFQRAIGYEHPETKVFLYKGKILTHEMVKHYAPDPTAAIFWLKNRQPAKWRDKQETEVTHKGQMQVFNIDGQSIEF